VGDFFADRFHKTRYFVPENQWQTIDRRNAAAIVRVGVANSAGRYSDQDFRRPDLWKSNLGVFQRFTDLHELDSPHEASSLGGIWLVSMTPIAPAICPRLARSARFMVANDN
jgi:hypothetical protein